ncbi:DTW domain-containing protein, partial [Sulfurimonas sp. SAG-AH-194-I05]
MCEYIQAFDTNTKFIILMHPKEFKKVKNNTGYFTHRTLRNSELFVGIDFSHNKKINDIIESHQSYILFPSSHATNLSEKNPHVNTSPQKNIAIFLIDSTWACTKKIFNESTNLRKLQHMSFTTTRTS